MVAAALVYAVSWKRGLHPTILTLVGIAVAALGSAIINLMIIHAKVDVAPHCPGWREAHITGAGRRCADCSRYSDPASSGRVARAEGGSADVQ